MSGNAPVPDYDLEDTIELTTAEQVRAISDPLRTTILGLLHERAATVTELASAVKRPKSTVAHHVNVLAAAGLLRVVRTRRVRAIDERYYGRAARMFYVGLGRRADGARFRRTSTTSRSRRGVRPRVRRRPVAPFIRHARIPEERAAEFWDRVDQVIHEFDQLPRSGDTVYGFAVGLYPMLDYPTLPPPADGED